MPYKLLAPAATAFDFDWLCSVLIFDVVHRARWLERAWTAPDFTAAPSREAIAAVVYGWKLNHAVAFGLHTECAASMPVWKDQGPATSEALLECLTELRKGLYMVQSEVAIVFAEDLGRLDACIASLYSITREEHLTSTNSNRFHRQHRNDRFPFATGIVTAGEEPISTTAAQVLPYDDAVSRPDEPFTSRLLQRIRVGQT